MLDFANPKAQRIFFLVFRSYARAHNNYYNGEYLSCAHNPNTQGRAGWADESCKTNTEYQAWVTSSFS